MTSVECRSLALHIPIVLVEGEYHTRGFTAVLLAVTMVTSACAYRDSDRVWGRFHCTLYSIPDGAVD